MQHNRKPKYPCLENRMSALSNFACLQAWSPSADILFYGNHTGITVPIFLALLCGMGTLSLHMKRRIYDWISATIILLIALIPAVEILNPLTFVIALAGSILFLLAVHGSGLREILDNPLLPARFLLCTPFRLIADLFGLNRLRRRLSRSGVKYNPFQNWFLPILMTCGFLLLFSVANPLIGRWLAKLDLFWLLDQIEIERLIFWSAIAVFSWPFLRPALSRFRKKPATKTEVVRENVCFSQSGK